jgi:hypothetical protein
MKNDNKTLESIGIALGLRGPSQKQCEKAAKRFTGRQRGKPIDLDVRKNIAKRLLMGREGDTYRSIANEFGVSLGSITNIKKALSMSSRAMTMRRRWIRLLIHCVIASGVVMRRRNERLATATRTLRLCANCSKSTMRDCS